MECNRAAGRHEHGRVDSAIRMAQAKQAQPDNLQDGHRIRSEQGRDRRAHGEPLGVDEVRLAKEKLGWPYAEPFAIPPEALAHFRLALERGKQRQREWQSLMDAYRKAYPDQAHQLETDLCGELPPGWDKDLAGLFKAGTMPISTRDASSRVLNVITRTVHALAGGSADLGPSTKTILAGQGDFGPMDYAGHNFHFGVREHAMGAIANGMSRHGGMIPYTATFLIFSDYMRPPMRLAALMKLRVIYVFTHDSVALGEDGPTHQPIEQILGLRSVPNLVVLRPADAAETVEAWKVALERRTGPTALLLTRQNVPVLDRAELAAASGLRRGGYVLWQAGPKPDVILIGTGSEVHIALEAGRMLGSMNVIARVVSLPSWALFDAQPDSYRDSVLPPTVTARVSIEAGTKLGWERYLGPGGIAIGLDRFGASAPGPVIYQHLGLTAQHVTEEALRLVEVKGK